ncbi:MAG: LCP family protein [Clostridia bacterium]|nr:LCP family protein [Clostridia bacterium]
MKKTWIMLGCVLAAFFLTWCVRTLYVVRYAPERAFLTASPAPVRTSAAATPTPTLSPEEQLMNEADRDFMQDRVNILLLGFDQSPEREDEDSEVYRDEKNNYRSDVLMLLAVNFKEDSAHLISVPRDTYTPIYNVRGRWKVNAAFAKGGSAEGEGFLYAQKTLEMLFGVPIPYYVGVNMEGLKALVDAIGGVDYDVDVEIRLNGRILHTGPQHLNGQQVLDYCRARKGISTDVGRNDRQQRMLFAIFEQMQATGTLAAAPKIYAAVRDDVYTNLSVPQIAALAAFGLELGLENLKRSTLEGAYVSNVYNASF